MFVKQIGMEKALELAAKGMEIKVLAPIGQEDGWENLAPDTLQHMLEGVMFFRQEPALEKEILPVVSREEPEPPAEKSLSDLTKELKQARLQKGKLDVDIGKMKALREAGWSYAKIADEMRISVGSVHNHLKQAEEEGMKVKIQPRKQSDKGGYIMMPMRINVNDPVDKSWKLVRCPVCGCECWERPLPEGYAEDMFDGKMCTGCVIRKAVGR